MRCIAIYLRSHAASLHPLKTTEHLCKKRTVGIRCQRGEEDEGRDDLYQEEIEEEIEIFVKEAPAVIDSLKAPAAEAILPNRSLDIMIVQHGDPQDWKLPVSLIKFLAENSLELVLSTGS